MAGSINKVEHARSLGSTFSTQVFNQVASFDESNRITEVKSETTKNNSRPHK